MKKSINDLPSPYLLTSQVTIAAGGSATADSGALGQPYRRPFWVDEVRWTIKVPGATVTNDVAFQMGGLITTKLTLGRMIISNDFIPIYNFAQSMQRYNSVEAAEGIVTGFGVPVSYSNYRWVLPKPLYVPSGMPLTSQFQRFRDAFGTATVSVSYAGRYISPGSKTLREFDVPFVTAFTIPLSNTATMAISGENDLVNPFLENLQTQRFIGRQLLYTAAPDVAQELEPSTSETQVLMKDSYGNNVIRDYTYFTRVFDWNRRAWTFSRTLLPTERYYVSLSGIPTNVFPSISLIGTRVERIAR